MPEGKTGASRGRRIVLMTILVAALAGGGAAYWHWGKESQGAQAARLPARAKVSVSVAIVGRQDVPIYLTGLGTVQATLTVGIHTQVDGKLQEVLFKEGQRVKKGDVLARIDPRLYQAALDQAKAKKLQDEAQLVGFEKDLARFQTLFKKGYDTPQNIDQQTAKVATTRAQIAADEAAIETAQTQLEYTTITAPNDGRMGVRLVDPGNVVHASDAGAIAVLVQ